VPWVRETLKEYLRYGFVEQVDTIPYCVMLLQVKATSGKMLVLNDYVEKNKFELEGWEMFHYAVSANCGIKFDRKKILS